jgi:short-subunit dehydrogenase
MKRLLILISRTQQLLEQLKTELSLYNIDIFIIAKDLALRNAYTEIKDTLTANNMVVDILVNNAGAGTFGDFIDQEMDSQLNIIDVNINALTAMTHIVLPNMVAKKQGCILNVSSLSGLLPIPNMSVYSASKAYSVFLSQNLSAELKETGVKVIAICLGFTMTPFLEKAKLNSNNFRLHLMPKMSSSRAASVVFNSMFSEKKIIIGGIRNRLLVAILSFITKLVGVNYLRLLRIN